MQPGFQHFERERHQHGQNDGAEHDQQVEGAFGADAFPRVAGDEEGCRGEQGDQPARAEQDGGGDSAFGRGERRNARGRVGGRGGFRTAEGVRVAIRQSEARGRAEQQDADCQRDDEAAIVFLASVPALARDARDEIDRQEQQGLRGVNERRLFGGEVQEQRGRQQVDVFLSARFEIAQHHVQHHDARKARVGFVADVAPVVQHVRRDDQQEACNQRAGASEIAPPPAAGHPDGGDAEQHGRDARGEVAHAEEVIGQREDVELERAVHHGRVLVALSFVEQVGEIGVQGFIVTHHTRFEIEEARHDGRDQDEREDHHLVGDGGQGGVNGAVQPAFVFHRPRL